jgi:tetratricopeptide (TPR) repeat protein
MGMEIDPTDMDLYVRRAALNFSLNYTKRALNDYLKILASGDSSVLYLKRSGIGYSNNLQPKEAIKYLLLAYDKDSSDIEVSSFLARNYQKINDLEKSAYYYRSIITTLDPVLMQLSLAYVNLAEALKKDGRYKESITAYLKGQEIRGDVNIYMIVANIYDENLNDIPKAIQYYQRFLDNYKNSRLPFQPKYVESVQKRLDFLKEKQKPVKK